MFRFYLELKGGKYVVLNDVHNIINYEFTPAQLRSVSKFVEIEYDSRDHGYRFDNLGLITPLDIDYVHGAAIKAANDHNESILRERAIKDTFEVNSFKRTIQDVVDMSVDYGEEFNLELAEKMKEWKAKFPKKTKTIKENTIILG